MPVSAFSDADREVVYRLMSVRRDIRHFSDSPLPGDVLQRMLSAAHQAPSVGFMQPWNFILISSMEIRRQIKESFERVNLAEAEKIAEPDRRELYRSLKLEGILDAPLNVAVTCDRRRSGPFVLGRAPAPETDVFSTCLAIQNLWLSARAEGVGVGWVSILDQPAVEKILELPEQVRLVAYLCVGYPTEFRPRPLLEEVGWRSRLDLRSLVYEEKWGRAASLFDANY